MRTQLPAAIVLTLLLIGACALVGCDEGGAAPAATAVQQPDTQGQATGSRGPTWGGNPSLAPAKRGAQNLKDQIESDSKKLADDIDRGNLP